MYFDAKPIDLDGATLAKGDPVGEMELFESAWESQSKLQNQFALRDQLEKEIDARNDEILKAAGEKLDNPFRMTVRPEDAQDLIKYAQEKNLTEMPGFSLFGGASNKTIAQSFYFDRYERRLKELSEQKPDLAHVFRGNEPPSVVVARRMREAEEKQADVLGRRGWTGTGPLGMIGNVATDPWGAAVYFGGSLAGQATSFPDMMANLVGLSTGPSMSIVRSALRNAVSNMAVQTVLEPGVAAQRRQVGLDYTAIDALNSVLGAGAMGFAIDAVPRSVNRTLINQFGRDTPAGTFLSRNTQRGKFLTDAPINPIPGVVVDPGQIQAATDVIQAAQGQARSPELQGLVDKAAKGDLEAIRELAQRGGVLEDPAIKGLFDHAQVAGFDPGFADRVNAEFERVGLKQRVDVGETERRQAKTIIAAMDPTNEPFPVDALRFVNEQRFPDLSNDSELPAGTTGTNQHGRYIEIDGRTAAVREIDLKAAQAADGVRTLRGRVDAMQGAWDQARAGRVLALEGKDGALRIVDGRGRLEMAQRADGETRAEAVVFREADGWSLKDVEGLALLKNIREGRGDVIEAAGVFRERPELLDGVLAASDFERLALSLSRLSDAAFDRVAEGNVDPRLAAVIADYVPEQAAHAGLLDDLSKMGVRNPDQARQVIPDLVPQKGIEQANAGLLGVRPDLDEAVSPTLRAGAEVDDPAGPKAKAQIDRLSEELAPEVAQAQAVAKQIADAEEKVGDLRREMAGLDGDALGAKRVELDQAETDLANLRRGVDGEKIYRLTMDAIALKREQDIRLAVSQALGLADRITPEGTKVEVADDLRAPDGRAVDATSDMATGDIQLALSAVDPMAKIGHEAVHTLVTKGHLSPDEVGQLAALAREAKTFADEAKYRDVYADRPNLDRLIDEEAAASYIEARIKGTVQGPVNTIVERIRQLLERIRQALAGFGFKSREDVVQAILNGEAARRRPVQEWMRANDVKAMATVPGEIDARAVAQGKAAMQRQMADGVELSDGTKVNGVKLYAIRAFHGSPHDFAPQVALERTSPGKLGDMSRIYQDARSPIPDGYRIVEHYPEGRFDLSRIGTGEGAQAYGHGLYFAESEGVARSYRNKLSPSKTLVHVGSDTFDVGVPGTMDKLRAASAARARDAGLNPKAAEAIAERLADSLNLPAALDSAERMRWITKKNRSAYENIFSEFGAQKKSEGRLYEVSIKADPEDFLDWDKPRDALAPKVQEWVKSNHPDVWEKAADGASLYGHLNNKMMGQKGVSQALREAGIPGIKYLDQGSRSAGEGSRNYVVFDDSLIEIVAKDGQPVQGQKMFAFAGENARTADKEALAKAQEMETAGESRDTIWTKTGWFRGVDGRWRFEIDDSNAKWNWIKGAEAAETGDGLYGNLMSHRALFEAYPFMQFMKAAGDMDDPFGSYFDTTNQKINVASIRPSDSTMAALHEGQHVIQQFERMPMGGDGFGEYQRLSGEVEARAVEARAKMTPEERRARPPWLDYDVPESEQIVGNDKLYSLRSDLDMSPEARKQRAEEMGFDTSKVWYHGTRSSFDAFNANAGTYGDGVYLTPDPKRAGNYAERWSNGGNEYPRVMPLYARGKIATKDEFNAAVEKLWTGEKSYSQAAQDAMMALQSDGYAGAVHGTGDVLVFDPKNIRSVNADFDPSKSDSPNLMYSIRDEERLQRAREMGFDTSRVWYHGTDVDSQFDAFEIGHPTTLPSGRAVWFASDADHADSYASHGPNGGPARIIPVFLRAQNTFDAYANPSHKDIYRQWVAERQAKGERVESVSDDGFDSDGSPYWENNPWLVEKAREAGYDSLVVTDGNHQIAIGVFDPKNIRSVNADFDPSKSDSPNLMYAIRGEDEPSPKDQIKATVRAYAEAYRDLRTTSDALGVSPDDLAELVQRSPETAPIAQRLEMARAQLAQSIGDEQADALTRALIAAAPLLPDVEPRAIADMVDNVLDQMFPDPPPPKPDPMTEVATPLQKDMLDLAKLDETQALVSVCRGI